MKTWVRKSLKVGVLSAGIILAAGAAAQAETTGNDGALTGNQAGVSLDAPIDICGNAVGVLGDASASCATGGGSMGGAMEVGDSGDNSGVGTGNQVLVPVQVPINICGNAIGLAGNSAASCDAGSGNAGSYEAGLAGAQTSGNGGALTGNQVLASVVAPITACGNAVGVLGDSAASCQTGGGSGGAMEVGDTTTGDNGGALTGNQVGAILHVPVNVCGNAVGILGSSAASCNGAGGDNGGSNGGYGERARHREGLPLIGDAAALRPLTQALGQHERGARHGASARHSAGARAAGHSTGNNGGAATGNQFLLGAHLPLTVARNAIAVAGNAR
jgi:ChpA-C